MQNKNYRIVYKVLDFDDLDYGKDRVETHHSKKPEHVEETIEDFSKLKYT